jgi:cholest-4-en-3-one 26-monooxygenase
MDHRHIDAALTDPGFFVDHDPHPLWKELRENDPIHWTDDSRKGFWSITRYQDIVAVVSEPTLFSSAYLVSLPSGPEMEDVTPAMLGSEACGAPR